MVNFCETCGRDFTNLRCPRCGGPPSRELPEMDDELEEPVVLSRYGSPKPVSVADDSLDHMIEQASRPTLASLLKRGIDSGLIKPAHDYSAGNTPTP